MLPTEAGTKLYGYVRQIVDLITDARLAIGGIETTIAGKLKIAACSAAAVILLPEKLDRFRRLYPQVIEELTVCGSPQAIRSVETGTAEFAVVVDPPKSRELNATAVAYHELVLVVHPKHDLASATDLRVAQLYGETLIGREPGSGTRSCIEHAFVEAGITPADLRFSIEMNSDDAIRAAVERGLGIAFLPRGVIEDTLSAVRLVSISVIDLPLWFRLYLVTDPRRLQSPAVEAFLRLFRE